MRLRFFYRSPDIDDIKPGAGLSLAEIEAGEDDSDDKSDDDSDDKSDEDEDEKDDSDKDKKQNDDKTSTEKDKPAKKKEDAADDKDDKSDDDDSKDDSDDDGSDDADEAEAFFTEVNELRGDALEVDYGTVDPLSAEGIVLRDKVVEANAVELFEGYLEERFPKAYGFLMHTMAGKPEADFFGKSSDLETLPTVEEIEASVEKQKEIITADLIAKGNSEKHAGVIVKQLVEDNELEEAAKTALDSRTQAQKKELDKIREDNDAQVATKATAVKTLNTYVDQVMETGKIGDINIPEKDRSAFGKSLKDNVRYENGKFVLLTELSDKNAQEVFAKEYFAFKKGDLGTLVKTAAKTQNAIRLKRTFKEDKTPKAGADTKKQYTTLGDIEAD